MITYCFKLSSSTFLPLEVYSIVHDIAETQHSLLHHAIQDRNSGRSVFAAPVNAIQSLDPGRIVAISEIHRQTPFQTTPHCPSTSSRMLYPLHCSSRTSSANPRSWLTDASPGPASEPRSPGPWWTSTGHQSSCSRSRGLVLRRLSRNKVVL